jgi:starch-binding outer membrane protein, SusD/RagB family
MRYILVGLLCIAGACDDFLSVDNRGVIDGGDIDAAHDAAVFAYSAQQNLAAALPSLIVYQAFFTGEAVPADLTPEPHDFARRAVAINNSALSGMWSELSVTRAAADRLLEDLRSLPDYQTNVHVARAALVSGFSYLVMAESFCDVAVDGTRMSSLRAIETAIARFEMAERTAGAGNEITHAALVGRARALLQAGQPDEAAATADLVPPGFEMRLRYVHDPANLLRLGNRLWYFTSIRSILAITPAFRQLNDVRVSVQQPTSALPPFDGLTEYWTQRKYPGYDASVRWASKVEAEYIAAEARGGTPLITLIDARRAANGQPAYAGAIDDASLQRELMEQRRREFFLEGKRLGDFRRQPTAIPFMPEPGRAYVKAGYGPIGAQSCWPLPE